MQRERALKFYRDENGYAHVDTGWILSAESEAEAEAAGFTSDWATDHKELRHFERHSPDGFDWGYRGSGPSDLAYAILRWAFSERVAGEKIADRYYQEYKDAVVAKMPFEGTYETEEGVKEQVARMVSKEPLAYLQALSDAVSLQCEISQVGDQGRAAAARVVADLGIRAAAIMAEAAVEEASS